MKAKIYPLKNTPSEIKAIPSSFSLHLEIICASLAKGISTIKNIIDSQEIQTTISWCKTIGANIKRSGDRLVIKGVANIIEYQHSTFNCGQSSLTAKMMLPLLCTIHQPFGIEAENSAVLEELKEYQSIFEEYGAVVIVENNMLRFEKKINAKECELDGDIDIALAAGLLIALPLISGPSTLKLRAPVRSEKSYDTILKILKRFHIDIKHPATMKYDISGDQRYKKCKITTEVDNLLFSNLGLLSQTIKDNNGTISIINYKKESIQNNVLLLDFMKKNAFNINRYFASRVLKKRKISLHKVDLTVENSLPLLMVIGSLNEFDFVISKVNFEKKRIAKQFNIMANIFSKLKLEYSIIDNQIIIHPSQVTFKKQVDCENDPYVAIAIAMLAMLSKEPIIIRNVECVFEIYKNFFEDLKLYGANIEFINA